MTVVLLSVLIIGYVALGIAFVTVAWRATPGAKWLGLAAIAAAAPFFFWMGSFAEQFGAGQCYSSVVGMIANAIERTDAPAELGKKIRGLPMRGYETSCSEVEMAAQGLPNAK